MEINKIKHFPNLDGLRFVAASLVIIHHVNQYLGLFGYLEYKNSFIVAIGPLAVYFFFVLSGYLITLLLLKEEYHFKRINIKSFYLKRVLRIWPLYFLVLFIGLFLILEFEVFNVGTFDKTDFLNNKYQYFLYYVLFFPQILMMLKVIIPFLSHLWTIGVEEYFYLIWPHLFKYSRTNRLKVIVLITIFIVLFHSLLDFCIYKLGYKGPTTSFVFSLLTLMPIQCMFIGAIGAIVVYQYPTISVYLIQKKVELFNLLVIIFLVFWRGLYVMPFFSKEIYSFLFLILLLNASLNSKSIMNLNNKFLIQGGKISYGLYMLHPIVIGCCIVGLKFFGFTFDDFVQNFLLYALVFLFSWLFSWISYKYFESYFLKLKNNSKITN